MIMIIHINALNVLLEFKIVINVFMIILPHKLNAYIAKKNTTDLHMKETRVMKIYFSKADAGSRFHCMNLS